MSRTTRRGYDRRTGTTHDRRHSRPDWSCGNPACCGGKEDRLRRRAERAGGRAELRRTVAEESRAESGPPPPHRHIR